MKVLAVLHVHTVVGITYICSDHIYLHARLAVFDPEFCNTSLNSEHRSH